MPRSRPPAQSPPQPRRSAFTLIEMVVVVGIIGILMALGIPGIISSIKKADLYATTNIIGTLHSFCYQSARECPTATTVSTTSFAMTIKSDSVVLTKSSGTISPFEVGKSFNFDSGAANCTVKFEDVFKPYSWVVYSGGPGWSSSASSGGGATWADLKVEYQARTGFVCYGGSANTNIRKIALTLKDNKGRQMVLTFWPTGAYNVKSG